MNIDYQIIILGLLGVMGVVAIVNVFTFRFLRRRQKPRSTPMVSVLVPARNEEKNIGLCLSTLGDQDYPNYEILVLDDNSDDTTADIIEEWATLNPKIRTLEGGPLPQGWIGKNYACHQLSQAAKGEMLLFVDADTMHSRESLSAAVAELERTGADLLTVIPNQILKTLWEKTILPLLHFSTFCFLPFPLVRGSRNPRFAMANGQYMLFRRNVYDAIGGHEAVRDAIVEDVWLSRMVKREGYSLHILGGGEIVSCRMYTSLRSIWQGFSKNLFAGFRFSLPTISAVVFFNLFTSVLPFVFLAFGAVRTPSPEWFPLVVAQVGIILVIRCALAARFTMSFAASLLHPLAMMAVIGIALNSARWVLFAGGARWKGRTYNFQNQSIVNNSLESL